MRRSRDRSKSTLVLSKSCKTYVPSVQLQEVFKRTADQLNIDYSDIDEIRKIYFSYFENYKNEIRLGNFPHVKLFNICRIIPDKKKILGLIHKMSNFKIFTKLSNKEFCTKFIDFVNLVEKIEVLKYNHKIFHKKYNYHGNPKKGNDHTKSRVKKFEGSYVEYYIKRSAAHRKRKINSRSFRDQSEGWDIQNIFL